MNNNKNNLNSLNVAEKQTDVLNRIIVYPDPILKRKCDLITEFNEDLKNWAMFMSHYMDQLNGVGLSGPQVGYLRKLFICKHDGMNYVFINTEIIEKSEETNKNIEGCLSIPGIRAKIERNDWVTYRGQRLDGEEYEETLDGEFARIFQHEHDHTNGILIIDRMSPTQKLLNKSKINKLIKVKRNFVKNVVLNAKNKQRKLDKENKANKNQN